MITKTEKHGENRDKNKKHSLRFHQKYGWFILKVKASVKIAPEMRLEVHSEDFNSINHVTMQYLMDAGVHLGHSTSRWNPRMAPYIFGIREDIHIIDLNQTVAMSSKSIICNEGDCTSKWYYFICVH